MNVSRLEPLGSDVARPPPRGVEEVGEVRGVVLREGGGLEGGNHNQSLTPNFLIT